MAGGVAAGIVVSNDFGAALPSGSVLPAKASADAAGRAGDVVAARARSEGFGGGRAGPGSVGTIDPRTIGSGARWE